MKVRTDFKAGAVIPTTPQHIERVVSSVADLVKGQNALIFDWAKNMNHKSTQVWSALTGQ